VISRRMMWITLLALSLSSLAAMLVAGGAPGTEGALQPLAQATPTETPPGDLTLYGQVYDAAVGPSEGIAGAAVSVSMCVPRTFHATSNPDGTYELFLPGLYLRQCGEVTLGVSATGYQGYLQVVAVAELYTQPQRDIGLWPEGAPTPTPTGTVGPPVVWVYLPVVMVNR
jgi:hypothetical protein